MPRQPIRRVRQPEWSLQEDAAARWASGATARRRNVHIALENLPNNCVQVIPGWSGESHHKYRSSVGGAAPFRRRQIEHPTMRRSWAGRSDITTLRPRPSMRSSVPRSTKRQFHTFWRFRTSRRDDQIHFHQLAISTITDKRSRPTVRCLAHIGKCHA